MNAENENEIERYVLVGDLSAHTRYTTMYYIEKPLLYFQLVNVQLRIHKGETSMDMAEVEQILQTLYDSAEPVPYYVR